MIEAIRELLEVQFYIVFSVGLVVLGFLAIGILERNVKVLFVPIYFFVLLLAGFIFAIYNRYKYDGLLELILGIFLLVAFIFDVTFYIYAIKKQHRYYAVIKASPTVDNTILAYLNNKRKVLYYTEEFLKLLEIKSPKAINNAIKTIAYDNKELTYEKFLNVLNNPEEEDFNVIMELEDGRELKLDLAKRKIIKNGKLFGYILLSKKQRTTFNFDEKEKKIQTPDTINSISLAIALYENNKYILNKRMKSLLNVEEVVNFDDYVYAFDRMQLEKRAKLDNDQSKIYYRIKTKDGFIWVAETTKISNKQISRIIEETTFRNLIMNFADQASLISDLNQLIVTNNNFILITISLSNLHDIKNQYGKDFSLVIASKFFNNLKSEIRDERVYELGYFTYAFILKNKDSYNDLLRDLHNNTSKYLKMAISFNDLTFELKNYVGLVETSQVQNPTALNRIDLAFKSLELASDKNYKNNYCIYIPKRSSLEELKDVDLSDEFINKITNKD